MFKNPVTIVDIETTGGSSKYSRIIEIAALRIENGKVVKELRSLVNPGARIPEFITGITGITNDEVADAPYFEDIACELEEIFADAIFLAHFAIFDFSFIKRQMEGCGYNFRPRILCSVKLSRTLYPQHKGHSLDKVMTRHNIQITSRHRAYDDAAAVYEFLQIARQDHGDHIFTQAVDKQLRLKSLPSNFDESQLQDVKNIPGVYIFKDSNNMTVYVGKSVSLRNRILSHFAQATKVSKELKISQNTHKLEVIETASELEALLLESKLIKDLLPVYNRQLRRKRSQTILARQINDAGYYQIKLVEANVSEMPNPEEIFGAYDNRTKAKEALQNARKTFDLCSKLLGLENCKGACFYHQLKKCRGACLNLENADLYNFRLNVAFERSRVASWKYKQPVAIQLGSNTGLLVDQWRIIGRINGNEDSEPEVEELDTSFDLDNYKILKNYITNNQDKVKTIKSLS